MKPVIFCRIAEMEYYKGITENDVPCNGGAYVKETGMAHECFNFDPITLNGEEQKVCLGFVMLNQTASIGDIQLHIENINGCELAKKEEAVEGVTVVWCAKAQNDKNMRVVGFYKDATVYRYHQYADFAGDNGEIEYTQEFNFMAKEENCVVLPRKERVSNSAWFVPASGKNGYDFGFGRSNIWYGKNALKSQKGIDYIEKMLENIENYSGENLIEVKTK